MKIHIHSLFFGSLLALLPFFNATSVYANGYLTLNSFSGTPGSSIVVSGGGFNKGDTIQIFLKNNSGVPETTAMVANDTNFSSPLVIPANSVQGPLSIIGIDASTHEQVSNSYYVVPLSPSVNITAPSHAPFAVINITGNGFAPHETISLELAGAISHATADNTGAFIGTLSVPLVSSGLYHVNITGDLSGASIPNYLNYFWIDGFYPSATPVSYYLLPGQTLSFTGSGFAPGEIIKVTPTGSTTTLSSFTTNASGSFVAQGGFPLPASYHGQIKSFTLTGLNSHAVASTGMTIGDFYPYASPSSYYILPGQTLSFTGGGFAAGEIINIYQGSTTLATPVATFTSDLNGGFANLGNVSIPFSATNGTIGYTLVGATSNVSASVTTGVGAYYPSISPSSYYVIPNSSITINGSGFAPNETVTLNVNGGTTTQTTVSSLGILTTPLLIPFGFTNPIITASGNSSHSVATVGVTLAQFYPSVTPSAYYAYPGDRISYSGLGFAPNETLTISSLGTPDISVTSNALGAFTTPTTTVPYSAQGTFVTTITGSLSRASVTSSITIGSISPYLSADQYSIVQGRTVHVTGSRFGSNEIVHVTAGSFETNTITDHSGNTVPVAIPTPYGSSSLTVTFTGNSTGATKSLIVGLTGFTASLTANNYYAQPGSTVQISGSGFAPLEIIGVSNGIATTTVTSDSMGSFTTPVTLPISLTSANNATVYALGLTSDAYSSLNIGLAPYTPAVSPNTYYKTPGTAILFSGTGFAPNEMISATFNGNSLPTLQASSTGSFNYSYTTPVNSSAAHFVFSSSQTHVSIPITVTIAPYTPSVALSTYYAQGGRPLTVTGIGFASNEQVDLSIQGTKFATVQSDPIGSFSYVGAVPFSPAGSKNITANGVNSNATAQTSITIAQIYPSLTLASYAGAPGQSVTFIGSGYLPNEPVQITTDHSGSAISSTFLADSSGNFTNSDYEVPSTYTEGPLVLTIKGTHSFDVRNITYYVTGK